MEGGKTTFTGQTWDGKGVETFIGGQTHFDFGSSPTRSPPTPSPPTRSPPTNHGRWHRSGLSTKDARDFIGIGTMEGGKTTFTGQTWDGKGVETFKGGQTHFDFNGSPTRSPPTPSPPTRSPPTPNHGRWHRSGLSPKDARDFIGLGTMHG